MSKAFGVIEDINAPVNAEGQMPLHIAAMNGDTERAKLLIEGGANVNEKDAGGSTPMAYAICNSHPEIVDLLKDKDVDINAAINVAGHTLLHIAAITGRTEAAALLIAKGANVHAIDGDSHTPMYYAVYIGYTKIVDLLQAKGVNINAPVNAEGQTPLHIAAMNGDTERARLLIEGGANVNAKNAAGITPMRCAAIGGHAEMVDLLKARAQVGAHSGYDEGSAAASSHVQVPLVGLDKDLLDLVNDLTKDWDVD